MSTPVEIRAPQGARRLEIVWDDDRTTGYEHAVLRALCPCAHCQGHNGPIQWVAGTESAAPAALELADVFEVGQYAIGLAWADGHSTGIYTYPFLQALAGADALTREEQHALTFER
jgi:DUF971 family protein